MSICASVRSHSLWDFSRCRNSIVCSENYPANHRQNFAANICVARSDADPIIRYRKTPARCPAASDRRWRTVPSDRISDGIRTFPQIPRSLLFDLSHSAARNVAIHPRTQRSASIYHFSNRVRFGSQAFPSIVIDYFGRGKLWLPLSFSLQKLASHLPHQVFAMAFYCRLENCRPCCGAAFVGTDH